MAARIKTVLFDMDNVLCAYDRSVRVAHLAKLAGSTAELVFDAIWASGFEALGDRGALDGPAYLRGFGERIGYPLPLDEWLAARRLAMTPNPAMLALVGDLSRSVGVAVLTNNIDLVADHIDRLFPELQPLFGARIFASARFKAAKPDPACFRRCLAELQAAPDEVLFVDDLQENVDGAREAGLSAHRYTTMEAFRRALSEHSLGG
jgi:glucose-1-phosphatase